MNNQSMSEAFAALSIIDLSNFKDADKESRLQVSSQLVEACHTVGFCYIAGHGIPQTDLDTAFAWNRKFHSLPAASKEPARRPESSNSFLGWHDIGKLTLHPSKPDSTSQFSYGSDSDPYDRSLWPHESSIPGFHTWSQTFYSQCSSVTGTVLRALALGLGLDEEIFTDVHDLRGLQVALKYYPPVSIDDLRSDKARRLAAHTDKCSLTLLLQEEQGGLEVEGKEGVWVSVDQIRGCFVLNVGDLMEVWSDNYLKSTRHRVGLPKEAATISSSAADVADGTPNGTNEKRFTAPRSSIPIFCKPSMDAMLDPLAIRQELLGDDVAVGQPGEKKWESKTFADFYREVAATLINGVESD